MAYKLTQADIDKYGFFDAVPGDTPTPEEAAMMAAASNERILTPADIETFQLTGAMAGEPASAADIAKMGGAPAFQMPAEAAAGVSIPQATLSPLRAITVGDNPAMPRADAQPIAQDAMKALGVSDGRQPTYSEARAAGMDPGDAAVASGQATQAGTTAPIVAAPQVAGMPAGPVPASLLQQPYSTDPFEGLSKRQRTILAFAAIADAGAALQGRQGTAFSDTMKGFSDIRDMERKRQIQTAELAARQQMLGALGASPLPPNATPEMIDAHIAKLTGILATTPSMAPYVSSELTRLNAMRDRAAEASKAVVPQTLGVAAIDALLSSPDLGAITGFKGTVNQFLEQFGAAPEYSNLMSYVDQLRGLNFLEAYQQLKGGGQITEIEGKQASAARSRLDRALRGRPEDLVVALRDARKLFSDAMEKNPAYQGQRGGLTEEDRKYLEQ
jgi:hypothetical protein